MLLSWFLNAGAKLPLTHLMTMRNMKLDQLKEGVRPPTVSNHMWTTTNELELSWVSILKIKSSRQLINWDRYQLSLCSAEFYCIFVTKRKKKQKKGGAVEESKFTGVYLQLYRVNNYTSCYSWNAMTVWIEGLFRLCVCWYFPCKNNNKSLQAS